MTSMVERRRLERFHVPNSYVKYQQEVLFNDQLPIEGKGDLVDLTVKGVRFETDQELSSGATLNIEIFVPEEEPINLVGHIVWTKKLDGNGIVNSVVEFVDFDDEPGFNSNESLEQLEALEEQYCRK